MAINKVILGKDLIIKEGESAIAGAISANLSLSAEMLDVTAKGSGNWTEYLAGMKSWNIDTDVMFTLADFSYVEKLGTKVTIELSIESVAYVGEAIINDIKINSGVKDILTYNISMTGSGEFKKKVSLPA